MFFYFITLGGFVGLANALPLYLTVQYHVSGVAAGMLVALIVAFGSGFRPVGGIRSLSMLVFQLIPLRFRQEIGLMTGMVGWAGGIGDFFLAKTLGTAKDRRIRCRLAVFLRSGVARIHRTCHGQGPLAHHLGRRIGSAGLTTRAPFPRRSRR